VVSGQDAHELGGGAEALRQVHVVR
jgi:hypothetical protein